MKSFLWLFALISLALAQSAVTVEQLKQFIHSSAEKKYSDKLVAKQLSGMKVSERITDHSLMEMLSESPGSLTSEAIKAMQTASQNLPIPVAEQPKAEEPKAPPIPPPTSVEQEKIIAEARELSLDYTKHLPDFICLEYTRRYYDPKGTDDYHLSSTVAARLSYFGQKEDYKVISVNDKLTETSYNALDGAVSTGEFGTMLREIFEPDTHAEFWFDRWTSLHHHLTLVFGYRVLAMNSHWTLDYNRGANVFTPGYIGSIFIDPETHAVLRVTLDAQGIPPSFPIQVAKTQLDYAYTDLSGVQFLLPSNVVMYMRDGRMISKNEKDFRNYRKYSAESDITFEADTAGAVNEEREKDKKLTGKPQQ
jgi:hypothetical protein